MLNISKKDKKQTAPHSCDMFNKTMFKINEELKHVTSLIL